MAMDDKMFEVTGIPVERVITELYKYAKPFGVSSGDKNPAAALTEADAQKLIEEGRGNPFYQRGGDMRNFGIEYANGRYLKIRFEYRGERVFLDYSGYDQKYGQASALAILSPVVEEFQKPDAAEEDRKDEADGDQDAGSSDAGEPAGQGGEESQDAKEPEEARDVPPPPAADANEPDEDDADEAGDAE